MSESKIESLFEKCTNLNPFEKTVYCALLLAVQS